MKTKRSATHFIGFYLYYGLSWPLLRLPLPALYFISDFLFLLLYYFPGYRKKVVMGNLKNAFPEKTDNELKKIAKAFYSHLCDYFVESFAILKMSDQEFSKRCVWKNIELLDYYYSKGKSVISVFGHYGNWEWLVGLSMFTELKVLALYKPLNNTYFDRYIKDMRQRFGVHAVPLLRSYPVMLDYHNNNIPTLTFFAGDQRPVKENIRYWTRFLNQDTPVLLGTEKIAKRLDQAVVFFFMNKVKRGYYEIEIIPVTDSPRTTGEYEITEMHTRLLEMQIRKNPDFWLWSHKRWKHKMEIKL